MVTSPIDENAGAAWPAGQARGFLELDVHAGIIRRVPGIDQLIGDRIQRLIADDGVLADSVFRCAGRLVKRDQYCGGIRFCKVIVDGNAPVRWHGIGVGRTAKHAGAAAQGTVGAFRLPPLGSNRSAPTSGPGGRSSEALAGKSAAEFKKKRRFDWAFFSLDLEDESHGKANVVYTGGSFAKPYLGIGKDGEIVCLTSDFCKN